MHDTTKKNTPMYFIVNKLTAEEVSLTS